MVVHKWDISIVVLVGLVVLTIPASAVETDFENAAVGRIVGDSPDELLAQLNQESYTFNHASYYSTEPNYFGGIGQTSRSGQIEHVLDDKFGSGNIDSHLGVSSWPQAGPSWVKNEFLVVEPRHTADMKLKIISENLLGISCFNFDESDCRYPSELGWQDYSSSARPLILLDSDYAGLYLPKRFDTRSFIGEFGQDSLFIGPTAVPNSEFVKALVCSYAFYSTYPDTPDDQKASIGMIYATARNSFHWESSRASGLSIMSYELYGLPYLKVSSPSADFDSTTWDYCKQYFQYTGLGVISSGHSFMQEVVYDVGEPNVTSLGNFSLLTTNNTWVDYSYDELVLPTVVVKKEFPLKTVVKNITLLGLEDPIDINVTDLPMWEDDLVNRTVFNESCWQHTKNASIDFSHTYTPNSEIVFVNIHPVEVLDCENGSFRVYRTVRYGIVYEAFSPVFLDVVSVPSEAVSGENVTVAVRVDNLINVSSSGLLSLESEGVTLFEGNISVDSGNSSYYNVSFIMPVNEGLHVFTLGFSGGNGSLTNTSFVIRANSLKLSLASPSFLYESMGLDAYADVVNGWNVSLDSKLEMDLAYLNGSKTVLADQRLDIPSNESVYSYPGIYKPAAGDYSLYLKVSSEISPGGKMVSRPLHVESLADLCQDQGNPTVSGNLSYSFAAYCKNNRIVVAINLTNSGGENVSSEVLYFSGNISSVRGLSILGIEGTDSAYAGQGMVSFNASVPLNSTVSSFLTIDLNEPPVILSVNHTPELSNGYSDLLFSVDWNDSEDDMSRLFVCKSGQLNVSGCVDGAWCNTSLSYDKPLQCDYLVYPVDDGMNYYSVFVCDRFGACSDAFNSSFTVDAYAPNITVSSPVGGSLLPYASSVWVNISTDENSTCSYNLSDPDFYFETDGVNFTQTGGLIHGFALNVTGGQSYYLYYKCKDGAGNVNDVSADHNFSVESSVCSSGGVGICGTNYCCGAADNICPMDFEGITCGVSDPDCGCAHGGFSFCGGSFCCGENDGVCPTDFDGVSCSVLDPDCSCLYGGVSICGNNFCCGLSDGVCPSSFEGVSCSTSDVDCV